MLFCRHKMKDFFDQLLAWLLVVYKWKLMTQIESVKPQYRYFNIEN